MDEKPNQFTNTIPNILDGIGKICSVFAHRKEVDHSQIINALHESQRQYSLQLEKMNQFQKQMIEQFNKINEENRKIKEEIIKERKEELKKKEEDEKKLKEIIRKTKNELLKETNIGCENLLNECEKLFDNKKSQWCLEDIDKKRFLEFYKIFATLKENGKLNDFYKKRIKEDIDKINLDTISCYNIQIVGYTGVGKSTLINSILREESNKAPTSFGKVGTLETKEYKSNKYEFIKFIDTRGSELDEKNNINCVLNETLKYIDEKLSLNDPNKIIHCLFYCINANRFQDIELNFLITLRNKYKNYEKKYLPIIIVYTQCISNKDFEHMKNYINEILSKNNLDIIGEGEKDINMINVLAESKETDEGMLPAKNLDKLMELAKNKSNYAINLATVKMVQEVCKSEASNFFVEQENTLIKSIDDVLNKKSEDEIIKYIIIECFKKYYNQDFNLSIECENIINDISNQFMEFIEEKNNENLNQFLDKNSDYIAKELLNLQTQLIQKKEINVNNILKNLNVWKEEGKIKLKERILKKSKTYAIRNFSKKLYFEIVEFYKKQFIETFNNIFKSKDSMDITENINNKIDNRISEKISEGFDELIDDLKNFQLEEKEKCKLFKKNQN